MFYLQPQMTSGDLQPDIAAPVARAACHFVVDQLPNRSLPELAQTLMELYEFYTERLPHAARLPLVTNVTSEVVRSEVRPPIFLSED